jgi:hypothetical protein
MTAETSPRLYHEHAFREIRKFSIPGTIANWNVRLPPAPDPPADRPRWAGAANIGSSASPNRFPPTGDPEQPAPRRPHISPKDSCPKKPEGRCVCQGPPTNVTPGTFRRPSSRFPARTQAPPTNTPSHP